MSYGLEIIGKDSAGKDYIVLDSTDVSTRSLAPAPNGGGLFTNSSDNRASITGSFASPTALPGSGYTAGDLVFARAQDNVARLDTDTRPSIPTFKSNAHYVSLRASNDLTSNVNGSDFGLLVKNSAGTPIVVLDSRKINSTVEVLKSYDKGSFPGGDYDATNSAYLAANLVWDGTSQTTAEFKNTYVTIGSSFSWATNDSGVQETFRTGNFYFNHSARKIYYVGYYQIAVTLGFGFSQFLAASNAGQIVVGEFKS